MKGVILLLLVPAALAVAPSNLGNEDLKPEASQQRIHDIIRLHEDYKYGQGNGEPLYHTDGTYVTKSKRPSYHPVAIKSYVSDKPSGYYSLSTPNYHSAEYQTLKPVSSKIYSYYPKMDSAEEHGSKHAVVYYPVKDQQYLDEPKYEKYQASVYDNYQPPLSPVVHKPAQPKDYVLVTKTPHPGYSPPVQKVYLKANLGGYTASPHGGYSPAPHDEYSQPAKGYLPVPDKGYTLAPHGEQQYHQQPEEHQYEIPVDDHGSYEDVQPVAPKYKNEPPTEHLYPVSRPKVIITKGPILDDKKEISSYGDNAYSAKDSGYADYGHSHHGDKGEQKVSNHHEHADYELKDQKSHSSHGGEHGEHSKYRNKGFYERDRGYHYEKAYAYDRIRAHHDVEKSKDSHDAYKSEHSKHDHHEKAKKGSHTHNQYLKKATDHHGGYAKHGHQADQKAHHRNGYHHQGQHLVAHPTATLSHHHHHHQPYNQHHFVKHH